MTYFFAHSETVFCSRLYRLTKSPPPLPPSSTFAPAAPLRLPLARLVHPPSHLSLSAPQHPPSRPPVCLHTPLLPLPPPSLPSPPPSPANLASMPALPPAHLIHLPAHPPPPSDHLPVLSTYPPAYPPPPSVSSAGPPPLPTCLLRPSPSPLSVLPFLPPIPPRRRDGLAALRTSDPSY